MATSTSNPDTEKISRFPGRGTSSWRQMHAPAATAVDPSLKNFNQKPTRRDALQALLAFSALHEQVRRRKVFAGGRPHFDAVTSPNGLAETKLSQQEFAQEEQLVLDEVLQLVADRAVAITGADGLAIALAEDNEIVLRASSGAIRPDIGARIDRDSAFSGACFRMAQVVRCDDTETDDRVNLQACRELGARSMVAVPLCGRRRVIGLLEAFSSEPFGFNDGDVRSLSLLAELVLGALKPEDEDRFAQAAQVAAPALEPASAVRADLSAAKTIAPAPAENTSASTQPIAETSASVNAKIADAEILDEPAVGAETIEPETTETEKLPELEAAAELEVAGETLTTHQSRPGVLLLLVLIVIASLLGFGLWWKLKSMQLGSAIVHTQKMVVKPATTESTQALPSAMQVPAVATPDTKAETNTNPDTLENVGPENTATASPGSSKIPRLTGIRHWSATDSSTVVLDLEDQVQYEAHRLANPDRIYFDMHDTSLAPELLGKTIEVGDALLTRVRVAQPLAGVTRVVLETKGNSTFSVSLEPNPYRLVVEVRKNGSSPKGAVNLFPGSQSEKISLAIVVPPPTKEDLQLRSKVAKMRIVVDAGHGGWDLGTVGRRGLLEKDLVLEIAQRLGKLLESRLGAEVIYTRRDDNYIPLDERAGIANQSQADLFVSVHANYSDLPSARGVETYYTNFFSAPGAKDADTRANNGGKNATTASLSPADLHERIEQSRRLAASVQRSLYGTLSVQNPGLRDRGVKEAGFVVLTETAMPGILAEVSFVSSPTDEQKLRSDGYREQIAEALYKGIARYAASSHGVKMASAAK